MTTITSDKVLQRRGWVMTVLLALFLIAGSVAPKFLQLPVAIDALTEIGWPVDYLFLLGAIELHSN